MNDLQKRLSNHRTLLCFFVAVVAGLALASSIARLVRAPLGHDQAWGLYAADQVMHGVQMDGPHLLEVNPPFFLWAFAVPVHLSGLLHLTLRTSFDLCFVFIVLGCVVWSASLFRRLYPERPLSLWLLVAFQFFVAGRTMADDDIGQREHIVFFLLLPYLALAALRLRQLPLRWAQAVAIGILTALAICLKPQHALDVLLVEGLILVSGRSLKGWFSPTPMACGAGILLYVASVYALVPTYPHDIVPVLRDTYWGFDQPMRTVVGNINKHIAMYLVCGGCFLVFRRLLRMRSLLEIYLAGATGALLAYMQQHKGWTYQHIPFTLLTGAALVLLCSEVLERSGQFLEMSEKRPERSEAFPEKGQNPSPQRSLHRLAAVVCAFSFLAALLPAWRITGVIQPDPVKAAPAQLFSRYAPGTPVLYLSVVPWQFPAVLNQSKISASRYMHLWMLPALVRSEDPLDPSTDKHLPANRLQPLSESLRQNVADDLDYWKPPLVVVDPCSMIDICNPLARERYHNLLGWFSASASFRQQWNHYRYQGTSSGLDVYTRTD